MQSDSLLSVESITRNGAPLQIYLQILNETIFMLTIMNIVGGGDVKL
jgi:hypothetical protein